MVCLATLAPAATAADATGFALLKHDATNVFVEVCEMVEEVIETLEETGKPVPQPLRSAGG